MLKKFSKERKMQLYQNTNFWHLCKKYIFPNAISAAFFSAYMVIDGVIVGRFLGSEALAAMGLVMPFVMMSFALADMIAIGSSVQISLRLGEGRLKEARELFSACLCLTVGVSFVLGLLAYFGVELFLRFMDAPPAIKALCVEYSRVLALFMPIITLSYALDNYLRICEKGVYNMFVGIFIVVSNVCLMYLFVALLEFNLFGAALALCLGLSAGTILSLLPFFRENLVLKFCPPKLTFSRLGNILYNGSSEFLSNVSGSLFLIFANSTLLKLSGSLGVAAFSAILYIDGFIISFLMAFNSSLQPLLSYFFAQKNRTKIKLILRYLLYINAVFSLLVFVILALFREQISGFFGKDAEFITFVSFALLLYNFNYLVAWFNVLVSAILTAFNKPTSSMILSLANSLIIPLFFLFLMSAYLGTKGVFLAPFFAELVILFLSAFLLKKSLNF